MEESHKKDDEEDPRVAMRERWHRIMNREMSREPFKPSTVPFVPRHIPDSEYLDAIFTLQIHPSSLQDTPWSYVKKEFGVRSKFPDPIIIHGRQTGYDLFTEIWNQWYSKWRELYHGFREEIEDHCWDLQVGLPSQIHGMKNRRVQLYDETGWLTQKWLSPNVYKHTGKGQWDESFGHYELMGSASDVLVGNMGLELDNICLEATYDYGSTTHALLQVISIRL
jgi:hypothetical protein